MSGLAGARGGSHVHLNCSFSPWMLLELVGLLPAKYSDGLGQLRLLELVVRRSMNAF